MGTIADPFRGLLEGVLQGHAIATQLRNQAMHEEAFQRAKQNEDRENQIKDIQNHMLMQQWGRPVEPGSNVVRQSFDAPIPSSVPGVPGTSQTIDYARPVDRSRLLTMPLSGGGTLQAEAYTPEEFAQRAATSALAGKRAEFSLQQQMADETRQHQLQQEGQPAHPALVQAGLAKPGELLLPKEQLGMLAQLEALTKPTYQNVPEGGTLIETTRPSLFGTGGPAAGAPEQQPSGPVMPGIETPGAQNPLVAAGAPGQQARQTFVNRGQVAAGREPTAGPRVVFAGQPKKQTPEEDYADAFARTLTGPDGQKLKSRVEMSKAQWDQELQQRKINNTDPDTKASLLATRASAEASRNLANAMRQVQLGQMPTKEDGENVADDLIAHRISPEQMTQLKSRGSALGLLAYREAKKKDPEFSWEKASSEYQLTKSPQFQQTVRYMDSVQDSIPQIIDRANRLNNGGIKGITAAINAGKNQVNNIDLKKFQTDATLVSDEIAKILSGGGTGSSTSDAKLKQAGALLGQNDSPAAIAAALGEVKDLIGFRRKALTRGTYLENANPAAMPEAGGGSAGGKITVIAGDGSLHPFDNEAQAKTFEDAVKAAGGTSKRQ